MQNNYCYSFLVSFVTILSESSFSKRVELKQYSYYYNAQSIIETYSRILRILKANLSWVQTWAKQLIASLSVILPWFYLTKHKLKPLKFGFKWK